ncbi:D-alanyl-D-alanine carboxypeptidase [Microbacteriaceae bacterium SG_E_30_P1]|uniref:D-alanyl-D-alanine carboxypeptidase n=1 Tax=Antiquaquibacter oligotrophicus TaxID=2880260 RepID=A0ABT6KRP8_9MICO|nr:D-alanyl-D-alanine carboxypeptidase family protein [Antiquaquibacter oligotrophicus]MDH6182531.1 D-alanyl-D-alanine carboxypeptidase [Antiquaquibacter oligotrophicus]UDF14500.1 D-alanyl-D-alanine carboxypeptidase family protein [Antiquaquibacter oligotrophicus]
MSLRFTPVLLIAALSLAGCAAVAPEQPSPPDPGPLSVAPQAPDTAGLTADDGYVAPGVWLTLNDDVPAITNLDPDLRRALDAAAAASDVEFSFTSGWRSGDYQQHLYDEAVANYGSEEEARKWVMLPDDSQHVHGKAVDVATADAMDWINRFGAPFGLCQIYANESWHFEFVPGVTEQCPPMLLDSTAG